MSAITGRFLAAAGTRRPVNDTEIAIASGLSQPILRCQQRNTSEKPSAEYCGMSDDPDRENLRYLGHRVLR